MFDSTRSGPSGRRSAESLVMLKLGHGHYLTAMGCCQSSLGEDGIVAGFKLALTARWSCCGHREALAVEPSRLWNVKM